MNSVTIERLIEEAKKIGGDFQLTKKRHAGAVTAAILTAKGNIYTGVNLELSCGIGFCAESSAVAEMLKHKESHITMMVAVEGDDVKPPCGRCRELLYQIHPENSETKIYLSHSTYKTLAELLPDRKSSK